MIKTTSYKVKHIIQFQHIPHVGDWLIVYVPETNSSVEYYKMYYIDDYIAPYCYSDRYDNLQFVTETIDRRLTDRGFSLVQTKKYRDELIKHLRLHLDKKFWQKSW